MTIYIPDDLAAELKGLDDFNVSRVCQDALRTELERRSRLAGADQGMERHEVWNTGRGATVAFIGKQLASSEFGNTVTVYLTRRHRLVVHDEDRGTLHEFDNFSQFAQAMADRQEVVHDVNAALHGPQVIELDI